MSYDLAVWVGERPRNDADAAVRYAEIMDRLEAVYRSPPPASERIRAYVNALLARWPDLTEDGGDDSPWADGPLIGNAFGDCIYFSMVWSRAEESAEFASRVAAEHGLVCFDPQIERLLPLAGAGASASDELPQVRRSGKRRWFGRS